MRLRLRCLASLVGFFALRCLASADLATLTVDVLSQTVDPPNPAVNTAYGDGIALRFLAKGEPPPQGSTIQLSLSPRALHMEFEEYLESGVKRLRPKNNGRLVMTTGSDTIFYRSRNLLVFRKCRNRDLAALSSRTLEPLNKQNCPFYLDEGDTSTIYINEGYVLLSILYYASKDELDAQRPTSSMSATVLVVYRPSFLHWSAGFAFFFDDLRDEEFRLTSSEGASTQLLESAGHGPVAYQLAALAHYRIRNTPLSTTFGLSTDIPVENLTAMLGLSYSVRTLPIVNSGHVTAGIAYAPRSRLRPEFAGLRTVPGGVTVGSLTRQEYDFGPFLAISFSFLGGEEQFKAVYSRKPDK